MIITHDTFVCKPGNASKLAKMCKEAMGGDKEVVHILTDMTGQFNRVIVVSQYEDLTAYDQSWKDMEKDKEKIERMSKIMAGYQDMYISGNREIYRVW